MLCTGTARQSNTVREEKRGRGGKDTDDEVRRAAGVLGVGAAAREDAGGAEERTEEERDGGRRLGGPTAQRHKCPVPPVVDSGSRMKTLAR